MTQKGVKSYICVPDFLKFKPTFFIGKYIEGVIVYPYSAIDTEWAAYKQANPLCVLSYPRMNKKIISSLFDVTKFNNAFTNSTFHVFNDGSPFVAFLMLTYPDNDFVLLEEGEAIYTEIKKDLKYYIKKISGYPVSFGNNNYIKSVEVRFPERLPKQIQKKSSLLDFEKLKDSLSSIQKSELLEFFKVDDIVGFSDKKTCLLLTQPLSEDGLVTEAYKIDLYKKIINEYCSGFLIFIKPHPREKTDYSLIIDNSIILPNESPIELISYLDCTFDQAITLFSSSIHSVPAKSEIFLSLDYDKSIKSSWMDYMNVKNVII